MNDLHPNAVFWRCRRGMLELDLILQPYFERCYADLSPQQQQDFAALLESPDPDLYAWLLGFSEPPQEFFDCVQHIRTHR